MLLDQLVKIRVRIRKTFVDLVEFSQQVHDRLHAFLDHLDHRFGIIQLGFLLQQAHRIAFGRGDLADIILVDPSHDAQQTRFSRAIQAQNTDFSAIVKPQRDIPQNLLVRRVNPPDANH